MSVLFQHMIRVETTSEQVGQAIMEGSDTDQRDVFVAMSDHVFDKWETQCTYIADKCTPAERLRICNMLEVLIGALR